MNFTICEVIRKCRRNRPIYCRPGVLSSSSSGFISGDELRGSRHYWIASLPQEISRLAVDCGGALRVMAPAQGQVPLNLENVSSAGGKKANGKESRGLLLSCYGSAPILLHSLPRRTLKRSRKQALNKVKNRSMEASLPPRQYCS
jgi:hypothetical protein